MNEMNEIQWLHYMRRVELDTALMFFPKKKNIKILELGGGDGYIAKCLADKGYNIISLDISPKFPLIFPVKKIKGEKLDFPSETFDLVFTSQVIAHVENLESFFEEVKRVLKNDGLIINLVPATGWWLITNFWHYALLPYNFLKFLKKSKRKDHEEDNIKNTVRISSERRIINYLFLHPLGTSPSFIHELIYFSKRNWSHLFQEYNLEIISISKSPYLYSGYFVFKMKLINLRKIFAKYFWPTTYCFVLRKKFEQ